MISDAKINEILAKASRDKATRAEMLPTNEHCIVALVQIYQRLKELGWSDPEYAPRNRSFEAITIGCSQVLRCIWLGGHVGSFFCEDGGDFWPVRIVAWREIDDAERDPVQEFPGEGYGSQPYPAV